VEARRRFVMCSGLALEDRRTHVPDRGVTAALVIEHFEVVEQLHLGLSAALEPIGQLGLDRREERFHHGVVVAITFATHTARDAVRVQHPLVILTRVGASLVGVMQQPDIGTAPLECHAQRFEVGSSVHNIANCSGDRSCVEHAQGGGPPRPRKVRPVYWRPGGPQ
jgi:hypothetical protein